MKMIKKLLAAGIAGAMIFSVCPSAFAAEDVTIEQVYAMAQKALDQQAIQNVMSRHVMYHCYGEHKEEMEQLWVNEPENRATASFGQNQGFFVGYDAIWDAYVTSHDTSWLSSAKSYCESNGIDVSTMTDEEILDIYGGVGQLLLHVTTTSIIEVAEDGQTAKCFWYSPGVIAETGQSGNTIYEAYGVDFVKEGDEWKIWHLHMFTDVMGAFYLDLGTGTLAGNTQGESDGEEAQGESADVEATGESAGESSGESESGQQEFAGEEGEQLAIAESNEYLYSTQYVTFTPDRLRAEMELNIPVAYEKWSFDDPNFGPTKEEWERYAVDLDAWYAAHE
ncbi:MAG: nuclear transport factor 2 family protein [Parasporobacterium sp.]|nr:nuclear transport factor 2 family protein [Parasporobacterium sp.]